MHELIIASANAHKIREIKKILESTPYKVIGLKDLGIDTDIEETADSLQGNARIKAQFLHQLLNKDILSEDSGLFVHALNGDPGVNTARYAGPEKDNNQNIALLLKKLDGIADRSAYFMTVICLIQNGEYHYFEGKIEGIIAATKRGDGGFGYDPVFIPEGYTQTFADLPESVKAKISHRARAVEKLINFLSHN